MVTRGNLIFDNCPHSRIVRALHYRYRYTKIGSKAASRGQWWQRELIGEYFPPVSEAQLRPILEGQGWRWYESETPQ